METIYRHNSSNLFLDEMLYWGEKINKHKIDIEIVLNNLCEHHPSLSIIGIKNNDLFIIRSMSDTGNSNTYRLNLYIDYFKSVLNDSVLIKDAIFGLFVDDSEVSFSDFPIFCFQKKLDSKNFLIPDVDMIANNFYDEFLDNISYDKKLDKAIFYGSTTGAKEEFWNNTPVRPVTVDKIKNNDVPRISAAMFFKNNAKVDFKIPNIVQYDNEETKKFIIDLGLGYGENMSILDQLNCKFLISIDGNGAACSRLFLAMKSNSVPIKYQSDYSLFFFKKMIPWVHYIPVESHDDVLKVIDSSQLFDDAYREIANNSKSLASEVINRKFASDYTRSLLEFYDNLIN